MPTGINGLKEIRPKVDAPVQVRNIFGPLSMNPVRIPSFLWEGGGRATVLITVDYNTPAVMSESRFWNVEIFPDGPKLTLKIDDMTHLRPWDIIINNKVYFNTKYKVVIYSQSISQSIIKFILYVVTASSLAF